MGVIRVPHNDNFTMMANYHLKDKRLSLRAVGLMSKMLSLPDDWDYTVTGLAAICKEGREAVRKVLQELEEAGYLVRDQSREGGRFSGYDYTLYEQPRGETDEKAAAPPSPGFLGNGGSPSPGFLGNGGSPSPRIPVPGFPVPEKSTQSSTKESSTKNNPPKAPQGAGAEIWDKAAWDRFWAIYPRKVDKAKAIRAWNKLKADRKLMQIMSAALKAQRASEEWRRDNGRAIPYPSTWLNNRRWEDETNPSPAAAPYGGREEAIEWEN